MRTRLTLIRERVEKRGKTWYGEYQCTCGKIKNIQDSKVKSGDTKSCGCLRSDKFRTHGLSVSNARLYQTWTDMKKRCYYKKYRCYVRYGGRGIIVCGEWKNDFKAFYDWAIKNGYADNLTIDRENNDGNYEPNNCKWITQKEQLRNMSTTIGIKNVKEIRKMILDKIPINKIAKKYNVSRQAISNIKRGKTYSDI